MQSHKLNDWITEDKKIKDYMINLMIDTFDEATMKYYYASIDEEKENTDVTNYNVEKPTTNFYECLFRVIDYFLEGKELGISEEVKEEIDQLLDNFSLEVEKHNINSEEIRRALLLLDIKAFKNVNFPLDIITPDAIGIIFARLINAYFKDQKELLGVDYNFGVGNLMFTIKNHANADVHMIGMENHGLLASVATHKANMLDEPLEMHFQDALEYHIYDIDFATSDVAEYDYVNEEYHSYLFDKGINYFPYLLLEHDLTTETPHTSFFLVNNKFFSHKDSVEFNHFLHEHGKIIALISLPLSFFQSEEDAKSIIILKNEPSSSKDMHIYMLPEFANTQVFIKTLEEIEEYLKNLN